MPALPAKFTSGRPLLSELSAERLNGILDEIRRNKPLVEKGLSARVTGSGTYIGLCKNFTGGGGAPTETHPFKIASSGDSVTVQPGTINNLLPANAFTDNALTALSLTPDTLTYVILRAVSADGAMTSCSLLTSTTAPTSQTPTIFSLPTTYDVLLGIVYNSTVRQVVSANLSVAGRQMFVTDRDVTTPGQLPYDVYFVWG